MALTTGTAGERFRGDEGGMPVSRQGSAWSRDASSAASSPESSFTPQQSPSEPQQPYRFDAREALAGELIGGLLDSGRDASFRVLGWSMHPTIRNGERVTLRRLGPLGARPGDIVAFRRRDQLVLHRVLEVRLDEDWELAYLTAGDGLKRDDGVQNERAIVGKVIRVHAPAGDWSPDEFGRRAQGSVRVLLGLHPRLRTALRAAKGVLRRARRAHPSWTEG